MRIVIAALAALLVPACAMTSKHETEPPFTASWERCSTYRDASVCAWTAMVQNGARVCAVRQDFATNAYYTHRLIGAADGNRAHFDRICGDPSSETDSFCAGQAPEGAEKVGWASYHRTLHLCGGRLSDNPAGCTGVRDDMGMTRVSTSRLPLADADRDWLAACAAGR